MGVSNRSLWMLVVLLSSVWLGRNCAAQQPGPRGFGGAHHGPEGPGRPGGMHLQLGPPGRWWNNPDAAKRVGLSPDQVKKMVRAIVKSLLFIRQQPEQVTTFAQRFWKLDRKQADKSYELIVKTMSRDGSATDAAMQAALYQAKTTSKVQKDIPVAQLVDLSFLREVQLELKLR